MYYSRLKLKMLLAGCLLINISAFCQAEQNNPVTFLDVYIGQAVGNAGGFSMGLGLNYQVRKNFFTARALGSLKFGDGSSANSFSGYLFDIENSMGEAALLYGIRTINEGHAYSYSLGVSYNEFFDYIGDHQYFGIPFEANIKWFQKEREQFKLIGFIPVGQPTGFGTSFGFKLFGNFSKQPYAGLGLSAGIGYHKVYD